MSLPHVAAGDPGQLRSDDARIVLVVGAAGGIGGPVPVPSPPVGRESQRPTSIAQPHVGGCRTSAVIANLPVA